MDNLTHSLVGLTAAKAGLDKLSPGATTLCVLAANVPDSDIATLIFGGRWVFLHHHRGITHSIIGCAVLAVALPIIFCLVDRIVSRIRKRELRFKFLPLLVASVLTTATHPILDWTNNYGMRFLLPWNAHWSYGDFAFVLDPVIWMLLGGTAFLMTSKTRPKYVLWILLGLATTYLVLFASARQNQPGSVWGLRIFWVIGLIVVLTVFLRERDRPRNRNIAIAALAAAIVYLGSLAGLHHLALKEARAIAAGIARGNSEQELDVAAMASLGNPLVWSCVTETDRATYKFNVSLLRPQANSAAPLRFEKPSGVVALSVATAEKDYRAQVLSEFMRFPAYRLAGDDCATQTLVQFADLRYTEPGKQNGSFSLEVPIECPVSAR